MGLDWNPGPKPVPGAEEEFRRLWLKLHSKWCWDRSSKTIRFREITNSHFETLRAPRVGRDPQADDWAREAFAKQPNQSLSENEFLAKMKGFYVLDLVPRGDGLPRYTNGGPGGYVEICSFRAAFLNDCTEIITEELLNQAYQSKLPEETARYGDILHRTATSFAEKNEVDVTNLRSDDSMESIQFRLDVVFAAARWCRFWSERGHWLEAYF